jgi:cytochrome c556
MKKIMFAVATAAVVASAVAGTSFMALGQDQSAATPNDVILARKSLMDSIGNNMMEIEAMTGSGKINLLKGQGHADSISSMLMAFPHLFPPNTNTWMANAPLDPSTGTFTDPSLWKEYAFFYKQARASSDYAHDASHAGDAEEFKKLVVQLRLTCDTCHAAFQKNN